jgi:hypothetical protein
VTKPNDKEYVFIRFLKDYGKYSLFTDIEVEIKKDNIYFIPYHAIK